MNTQPISVDLGSAENLWVSLDELRRLALAEGCAPDQFTHAIERASRHPIRVARCLKQHCFLPTAKVKKMQSNAPSGSIVDTNELAIAGIPAKLKIYLGNPC